jgi:hypothetical protein
VSGQHHIDSPHGVSEVLGGFPVAAAGHECGGNRRNPGYARTGRHGTPKGSGVTVGGDENRNPRIDLPPGWRLSADGDRLSPREA